MFGGLLLAAIAVPLPTRAATRGQSADTAILSGVVTTGDRSHEPVGHVIVTATGTSLPAARSAITDDAGRFTIDRLPAGRYALTAKKATYVPATYGTSRPRQPGVDLTLAPGQQLADLVIVLTPGAAIDGTIRDVGGHPLPNAQVAVTRMGPTGPSPAVASTSDGRGRYRVFGLEPGEYLVSATESTLIATVAGAMTSSEIDATLAALERGQRSGDVAGAIAGLAPPRTINITPVFYPGTLSPSQAAPIHLAAGEERSDVDIEGKSVREKRSRKEGWWRRGRRPAGVWGVLDSWMRRFQN